MRLLLLILPMMLFHACTSDEAADHTQKGEEESAQKQDDTPKINMIPCEAHLGWSREKALKHAETSFKLGETEVDLNINNLSFKTDGDFKVTSANYYKQNGMYHAIVKVDLRPLKALQKDTNDRLALVGPNYLNIDQYPTASINLTDFNGNRGDEGLAILRIKDQDIMAQINYNYVEDAEGFKSVIGTIILDAVSAGLINPEMVQDIEKDEITINIELNR